MEEFDGQGGQECKKYQTVSSFMGYHQCPETTENPGGWFLGQLKDTAVMCVWHPLTG